MQNEDTRYWYYDYTVEYDIGCMVEIGFGNKERAQKMYRLINEAQNKFRGCYTQSSPQVVMYGIGESIYFDGWSAHIRFTEWGTNRTYRNYPYDIPRIDEIINYVVDGMGGHIVKRSLKEMPIEFTDVSEKLSLPMSTLE